MRATSRVLLAALFLVSTALAAAPPYVGKWKVNPSKSQISGDTVSIVSAPNGMMAFNSQGFAYTFKLDGKEYPMPNGGTTAWTAASATAWDVSNKVNGKLASTYHLVLAGDVLTVAAKTMNANGSTTDFSATYKRQSGGPGFVGKWMSTDVKMPMTTLEVATSGADGVLLKNDTGPLCSGQFDSKENPGMGMMGAKTTCAFKKVANGFEMTSKTDGKEMYVETYTVSADGKTLTINGTPTNAKTETYKIVFDRQQ